MRVREIRGIQIATAKKLTGSGVKTADQLLDKGRTPQGRKDLATQLGVTAQEVLELVNRADLARVKGIGEVYSNLLEQAGVDTMVELSKRVPANLHAKLVEQTQTGDARRAPTLSEVQNWVKQAKDLGRKIDY